MTSYDLAVQAHPAKTGTIRPVRGGTLARESDPWTPAIALSISAIMLGHALQLSNGLFRPQALLWLTVAFIVAALGMAIPAIPKIEALEDRPIMVVLGVGLAWQFRQLLTTRPAIYLRLTSSTTYLPFVTGLVVAAILVGLGLFMSPRLGRAWFPLLLLVHFLLGVWLIKASPRPFIDVYVFQRNSSIALLHGINPYTITFPDIYGHSSFYGPGLSVNGRLRFGFPYPPLSLFLALLGHIFGGDYRYALLAAMTLAGACMAYARPGRLGAMAAATFLFTPRVFFVLEQGWTEPLVVLLLCATVFCACREPKALPLMLGLLLAIKQYLVLAVPLVWLLLPGPLRWRDLWRLLWQAGLVACVVTLPLMLWNIPAFMRDVVVLQLMQPFRLDALSYLVWFVRAGGSRPPIWVPVAAIIPAIALALWRSPRTPAGFASAIALVFFAFFAFNKQAFCNYYFFVVGALCCAVATTWPVTERDLNR